MKCGKIFELVAEACLMLQMQAKEVNEWTKTEQQPTTTCESDRRVLRDWQRSRKSHHKKGEEKKKKSISTSLTMHGHQGGKHAWVSDVM
jgi:hypothetical protein